MEVKFITATPDAEKLIAYCARVSSPHQDKEEVSGLLNYCWKKKHWSIFEQAHMTVEITTSRGISPQILRHRSFVFQEFSQRYAKVSAFERIIPRRQDTENRQNSIADLSRLVIERFNSRMATMEKMGMQFYEESLNDGIAKESARFLLPLNVQTKLYMTGNIRSWIHYLQVRTEEGVQKEHADIAFEIRKIFVEKFPIIGKTLINS